MCRKSTDSYGPGTPRSSPVVLVVTPFAIQVSQGSMSCDKVSVGTFTHRTSFLIQDVVGNVSLSDETCDFKTHRVPALPPFETVSENRERPQTKIE